MAYPPRGDLVISAWSATSPFGLGADALAAGLRGGRSTASEVDVQTWGGPYHRAGLVPDFDVPRLLGSRGTRGMDRSTALAVVTMGMLLRDSGIAETGGRPGSGPGRPDIGVVLGTGCGSAKSIMDFTRSTFTGERPFHVDPALFPNTVMNRAAGQSAIWYGLKGPNTTIAGGALTALLALNYARRMYRAGRCATLLCGAVEEYSAQRGWLEHRGGRGSGEVDGLLGEGCAMFVLEPEGVAVEQGRRPLATLLGLRFRAVPAGGAPSDELARCIEDVLDQAGAAPSDVRVVAGCDTGGPLADHEAKALAQVLGAVGPAYRSSRSLIGDTGAAAGAFQLASAIAAIEPASGERLALVPAIEPAGTTGCALLRLPADPVPAGGTDTDPVRSRTHE